MHVWAAAVEKLSVPAVLLLLLWICACLWLIGSILGDTWRAIRYHAVGKRRLRALHRQKGSRDVA